MVISIFVRTFASELENKKFNQFKRYKIMAKKSKSFGYIHDLLHFDYGYTDDEVDEIIDNNPNIFDCSNSEIIQIASETIKR